MCAAIAGGCRGASTPARERAFSLEGQSPRILRAARAVDVPLTLTNTGSESWDPERVHVSYHWLWLVPRELASRSRNVPYQDGVRTELGDAIPPKARVAVAGRLLPPSFPGLYWLQWDMVEEGTTWFSQVSPRQPRQIVLVLPGFASFFAPLPLMIALLGLYAIDRIERFGSRSPRLLAFAASSDLAWAAAALFVKPLILADEALLEPTAVAYWLMIAAAVVPPLVLMLAAGRRARGWPLFVLAAPLGLLILGDLVYYKFFGDVLSVPALLAVNQTGRVWGTIRSLLTARMIWLMVDMPIAMWLVIRLRGTRIFDRHSGRPWKTAAGTIVALAASGLVVAAPRTLATQQFDQVFRDRAVMEQLGPFGFHAYDLWNYARSTLLRPTATDSEVELAFGWFAGHAALRSGSGSKMFGAALGKNLIVIQVESLQDFTVDFRVGGQSVMPNLNRWNREAVRFTNVTDQTSEGRTSDAEFTMLASLLPLDHGAVIFRHQSNHYVAFPKVLAEHGYATVSAVAFEPGFWNRGVAHPGYGFERSFFESDFQMIEQIGWGLNDRDFLMQMAPRLEELPEPFCGWLITLSLHHPFEEFPDAHKVLKLGVLEGTAFGNYLHTMHFFDQALEEFTRELARAGLLDRTVLAVFGDHDAGFARDPELAHTIGIGTDEASWLLADRIPLFIRLPRPGGETPVNQAVAIPAGQTDFAPTMLALLGIDPAPLPYVGRNLLGAPGDPPVLRPYGEWLDRAHLMLGTGGSGRSCYTVARRAFTDASACAEASAQARSARNVSRLVITEDLQESFRSRLATEMP